MANSLLDFVMSLVRDADAAARYAVDPEQAIADANLMDVTSADVSSLIPVVSESLSMGAPATGADVGVAGDAGNVWASGAATTAFDAFSAPAAEPVLDDAQSLTADLIDQPLDVTFDTGLGALDTDGFDSSLQLDGTVDEDPVIVEALPDPDDAWQEPVDDAPGDPDAGGFDILS